MANNNENINNYNITIDFGTCNSVVSYIHDNTIKQINDDISADVLIPTTIYFISENLTPNIKLNDLVPEQDYYIGSASNDMVESNKDLENYFFQFKRFLGITSKSIEAYKDFLHRYNFNYSCDEDTIYFYIKNKQIPDAKLKISICDLIKLFMIGLKKNICSKLNIVPDTKIKIILTCPAYFHDLQRSQLKRAVEQAGFEIFKLVNEPTAAAVYYIHKFLPEYLKKNNQSKINDLDTSEITNAINTSNTSNTSNKFIIYDVGGGTIDTTVVEYYPEHNTCEVIDIDGNNGLGGIDIDNILMWHIINTNNIDKSNVKWMNKIKKYAEEIKIKLTNMTNYYVCLENVPIINKMGKSIVLDELKITYSRHLFNNVINELMDRMTLSIKNMFDKHKTSNIIFIGGPTQIPLLQQKIQAIINSNSSNTIGANSTDLLDMVLYKTIVSMGASILFNKIEKKEDFRLLDIIPMNIGISGMNDDMIVMIEKNSKVPTSVERYFSTSHDCQRTIDIEVYEGTNNECGSNAFIGKYKIVGIPPLPMGMILIKLLFKISYNGILDISINGFKNPSDNSAKSFDFKLCENIKIIPNIVAKEMLKKLALILNEKK